MAAIVYLLCAVTSAICTILLLARFRRGGARLLFWSGLCFLAFTFNNVLLFVDLILLPGAVDLLIWRSITVLIGLMLLIYGLTRTGSEP
jgi:tetrahydromethanopterin S-methyltransferase subunit D